MKHKIFKKNWILILLIILLAIRIALPFAGKYAVNWYLGKRISPYHGHIEDFDLSLYRGAYQFQGFVIKKYQDEKTKKQLDPLIQAKEIDISLAWRALIKGKLLGDLVVNNADITFLDSQSKSNSQSGLEGNVNWKKVFVTLVPIDIELLEINNSTIAFKNYDFKKPISVYLSEIELTAKNINNSERRNKAIFSDLDFSAKLHRAPVVLKGSFDILAEIPAFDFAFILKNFTLPTINDLLLAYGPLSFTSGNVSIYSEMATKDSRVDGYIKAFFKKLDVIAPKESFKGIKHIFYEVITALGNLLLRDRDQKEVAFRVPIDGPITQLSVSMKDAFFSALKNALKDEKLKEGLEKSISLSDVKKGKKPEATPQEKEKIKAF